MKYKGVVKGSRTLDASVFMVAFGVIEQNLPLVKAQLGDYYGFIFMAVGIVFALLRKMTTKPL